MCAGFFSCSLLGEKNAVLLNSHIELAGYLIVSRITYCFNVIEMFLDAIQQNTAVHSEHLLFFATISCFISLGSHGQSKTGYVCDAVLHDRYLKCNKLLFLHLINNYCICGFLLNGFFLSVDATARYVCTLALLQLLLASIHLCPANISHILWEILSLTLART